MTNDGDNMQAKPSVTRSRSWVRALIAVFLIAGLFGVVGLRDVITVVNQARISVLWLAIPPLALAFVLSALALWVLCRNELNGRVGIGELLRAYLYSAFFALWLPGRIGDFSIVFLLRHHLPASHGLAYVVIDKLASVAALMLCAVIGTFLYVGNAAGALFLVASLVLWWILVYLARHRGLVATFARWIPRRVRRIFLDVIHALHRLSGPDYRRAVLANVAIKLARIIIIGWAMQVLVASFGGELSLALATVGAAMVQFLTLIPISIQGIGVQEFAYLYIYGVEHVAPATVVMASFAVRVISIGIISIAYLAAHTHGDKSRR